MLNGGSGHKRLTCGEIRSSVGMSATEMRMRSMPRLYCADHGKEHEARTAGNEALYRQEGETVLIVQGRLNSGPWRCDHCNTPLGKGDTACLIAAFPRWLTASTPAYDFAYERQYFAVRKAEITAYGAAWQGVADALGKPSSVEKASVW